MLCKNDRSPLILVDNEIYASGIILNKTVSESDTFFCYGNEKGDSR